MNGLTPIESIELNRLLRSFAINWRHMGQVARSWKYRRAFQKR
jgi:hypothetical protein